MDTIQLHNVLPQVFAGRTGLVSDVWLTDVEFRRGTAYLVAAESGRGKSSFCAYVYGYRKDYSGSITFDGQSVASLGINEWAEVRRRRIAYLPQEASIFRKLSVENNIRLVLETQKNLSKAEKEEMLREAKADSKIQGWIEGKTIVKEIVVPNKLVNIVVK